jgi:hypothetical protein
LESIVGLFVTPLAVVVGDALSAMVILWWGFLIFHPVLVACCLGSH